MRNAFAKELNELAKENEAIVFLSGDIGNRIFDHFKELFPNRFFNCGIAEANMMGMAAGMALCGIKPVVYTITPFVTTRCLEQIKIDICYQNLPVIIIGVGSGLCYSVGGATHCSPEDIGLLRLFPNMTILCPGDAQEVKAAIRSALNCESPVYIRLGKKGEPIIHPNVPDFTIGKGIIVKEGNDICILSTGNMLPVAKEIGEYLETKEITTKVISFHTIKPLDEELLQSVFSKFKVIVTLEEHSVIGGLGGGIAEWLADNHNQKGKLVRIGIPDKFMTVTGNQEYARQHFGLTPDLIIKKILKIYEDTKLEHENKSCNFS